MDLAVRTTASPTAIWVIVVVMVLCTGILVAAPAIADSRQARASRRAAGLFSLESTPSAAAPAGLSQQAGQPAGRTGGPTEPAGAEPRQAEAASGAAVAAEPVPGGPARGEPVPAQRSGSDSGAGGQAPGQPAAGLDPVRRHRRGEGDNDAGPAGEAPTLPDMPPVGRQAMPAQRGGDGDQAERSHRATRPGGDDQPGPDQPGQN
jgi:hypothetical protein